jgi:hypothetical protein
MIKKDAARWCDEPRRARGMQVCFGDLPSGLDWSNIVSQLEANDLWDLPDASTLPPPRVDVFDGEALTVELHSGDEYRSYQYGSPGAQRWPEAADAARILDALRRIGPSPRYEIDAYGERLDSVAGE